MTYEKIKITTLRGTDAERLFLANKADGVGYSFSFSKDENGEQVAEIYAEYLVSEKA